MNSIDALGLYGLGIIMRMVPALNPDWFPPTGCDGTSAQAIWLAAMGAVLEVAGISYLLKCRVLPFFLRRAAFERPPQPQSMKQPPLISRISPVT